MEKTINIKFDEEQLDDIVKRVTENIIKEAKKDSVVELTYEEPNEKLLVMYLEFKTSGYSSEVQKLYFGSAFNTLIKKIATEFDLSDEIDRKKVNELKSQGWKEEVFYK